MKFKTLLLSAALMLFLSACDGVVVDPHSIENNITGVWELEETTLHMGLPDNYVFARLEITETSGEVEGMVEFEYKNLNSPQGEEMNVIDSLAGAYRTSESAELILFTTTLTFFFSGDAEVPGRIYKGKVTIVDSGAGVIVFEDVLVKKIQ